MNTFGIGSTSAAACGELLPSYYAVTIDPDSGAITATAKCPYNFFCPGGAPSAAFNPAQLSALTGTTVEACPYGSWTQQEGASSDKECSELRTWCWERIEVLSQTNTNLHLPRCCLLTVWDQK